MYAWTDGTDYLMHHGVKDMKWHVRRYQYEDGSLTPLGRIHYGIKGTYNREARGIYQEDAKRRKLKKAREESLKKAREEKERKATQVAQEKEEKEKHAAMLKEVLKTGTAEEIMKYKGEFTNEQLRYAYERLQNESNLARFLPKPAKELTDIDEIVRSGNAAYVLENTKYMTDSQLESALKRLQNEKSIKGMLPKEKTNLDKFMKFTGDAQKFGKGLKNGLDAYESVATVMNSVFGTNWKILSNVKLNDKNSKGNNKNKGNNDKQSNGGYNKKEMEKMIRDAFGNVLMDDVVKELRTAISEEVLNAYANRK